MPPNIAPAGNTVGTVEIDEWLTLTGRYLHLGERQPFENGKSTNLLRRHVFDHRVYAR